MADAPFAPLLVGPNLRLSRSPDPAPPFTSVAFADTFNTGYALDTPPLGWSLQTTPIPNASSETCWHVRNAPSWGSGRCARGKTLAVNSCYLTKTFDSPAGADSKIRLQLGTDQSPITTRNGDYRFYSGTTLAFSVFVFSDAMIYVSNMATALVVIKNPYLPNTLYDIKVLLGSSGAIVSADVNGSVTTPIGTMSNSLTSIDTLRVDNYNGALTPVGHILFDSIIVDNSQVAPNGTLVSSGSFDGVTLGANAYGEIVLGYTNGSAAASAITKLERSANGGGSWTAINHGAFKTSSGFLIYDSRPGYQSPTVTPGNTATYRVTASNASGDQVL